MIRFIVERHSYDFNSGQEEKIIQTFDFNVPMLENMLTRGGSGPSGFDSSRLVGVEVVYTKLEEAIKS